MALEGTLKDFGLADILQLIALQKKTGVLTLESRGNTVNISFKEGKIVSIDTPKGWEGDRLGEILVKAGKISREELMSALEINRGTGQRLGYILLKEDLITKDALSVALQHQIKSQIIRFFHWKEGSYKFIPKDIPPSEDLITPIDTEYILMEGLRIIDEWPSIEHRIPSFDTVLKQVKDKWEETEAERSLTENDKRIFELVDGKSDISIIIASSGMDEIDACNTLIRLMDLGLIEKAPSKDESKAKTFSLFMDKYDLSRFKSIFVEFLIILFIIIEGMCLLNEIAQPIKNVLTLNRIESLQNSIRHYYLDNGEYPSSLKILVKEGYKKKGDIFDLWGSPYLYKKLNGSYEIYSSGPDRIEGSSDDIR